MTLVIGAGGDNGGEVNENTAQRNQCHERITICAAVDGLDGRMQHRGDVARLIEDAIRKELELRERKWVAAAIPSWLSAPVSVEWRSRLWGADVGFACELDECIILVDNAVGY